MFQKSDQSRHTVLAQESQVFQKRLQFDQEIKSKPLTSIQRVDVMISLPLYVLYAFCTIHTLCMEISTECTYVVDVCSGDRYCRYIIVEVYVYMSIYVCMGDVKHV